MDYKLEKLDNYEGRSGPLLLIVMDGIGIGKKDEGDAVFLANPTNLNRLEIECKEKKLYTSLKAHGPAVGLPDEGDMGNSEVGHNAMGAGKIYAQGAKLVNGSILSGRLFETETWKKITDYVKKSGGKAHFLGLISDGNVHSHITQLNGLIDGIVKSGVKNVCVHALLDGRDVPEHSALEYILPLENKLKEIMQVNKGYDYRMASGGGRMFVTMDRYESDWKVVKRGWDTHVRGVIDESILTNDYKGFYNSAEKAILDARKCFPKKNDQTLPPFVIVNESGKPVGTIDDGDIVINFNFRGDRAIQISKAFELDNFTAFDRVKFPKIEYAGLLEYDDEAHIPSQYLVPPPEIKDTLGDYMCANNITQFAIAETHKYGHVTYFWNGNRTGYVCSNKENYIEIKSEPTEMIPNNPDMMADKVLEKIENVLKTGEFKFVRVNFANGDMVGHTGLLDPTITAVKKVDECVGKLVNLVNELGGITIITADHGNADEMKFKDGSPKTSHTLNPVHFMIVDKNNQGEFQVNTDTIDEPGLTNIAATVINLLGFKQPADYRDSLIKFTK